MQIRPTAAFAGLTALAAVAFAPAAGLLSVDTDTLSARDGLAQAFASGNFDVERDIELAELQRDSVNVPFGVTVPCVAGFALAYECENVDLAAHVPLAELGGGAGSDSWGWYDDNETPDDDTDDRQIALYGTTLGLTYTDITNPNIPVVLGRTRMTPGGGVLWRDVKVYDDHAFFVSEEGGYGVKVIDLNILPETLTCVGTSSDCQMTAANEIPVATTYTGNGNAHNIWINVDTARAYVVGSGGNDSAKGLHILDISDPKNPTHIGDFAIDGYTHDVECVIYTGPDDDYNGNNDAGYQAELCFASNEDSMTVADVTDAANTKQIAKINYQSASYTHQSAVTDDMQWLLWNDETDEGATGPGTRTYWTDISDLDLAIWQDGVVLPGPGNDNVCVYTHDLLTVDHNMYITGDVLWQANYNGGLQIFRISDEGLANCEMERIGYFDVDPGLNVGAYGGAWNVYPHFGQNQIIVSTLDEGLFVLQTDFEIGQS